jgi:hypothetical protein
MKMPDAPELDDNRWNTLQELLLTALRRAVTALEDFERQATALSPYVAGELTREPPFNPNERERQ